MLLFDRWYRDGIPGGAGLFVEGLATVGVGTGGALLLFPEHSGLVAIFLCALASLGSIERQLAWNRTRIVERGEPPLEVNARFTGRVLALFAGQLVGFSAIAASVSVDRLGSAFVLQLGGFARMSFATIAFPPASAVLAHNLGVLSLFFVLALLFRHGGALLAIAWNASVWGVVFGWLARTWSESPEGPPLAVAYGRVLAGVLPHMALEAVGYVLAGFAGVFLGLGLARYDARSRGWDTLLGSVTAMVTLAVLLVVAGAAWEGGVASAWCRWLAR